MTASLQQLLLFQTNKLPFPNDNMIEQSNIQKLPHVLEPSGDRQIPGAGFRVTAGMVMEGDDRKGIVGHGGFEDFAGFDDDRFQAALA